MTVVSSLILKTRLGAGHLIMVACESLAPEWTENGSGLNGSVSLAGQGARGRGSTSRQTRGVWFPSASNINSASAW